MIKRLTSRYCSVVLIVMLVLLTGCTAREERQTPGAPAVEKGAAGHPSPPAAVLPDDVIIEVNDAKLTRSQLHAELDGKLPPSDKTPPEARAALRRQLINDFIARSLLVGEVNRLQIKASEEEVNRAMEQLQGNLPPGITIADLLRRNETAQRKIREEIGLGIKINKLVMGQLSGEDRATEKEIFKFYEENKAKFKTGEAVHVRHILVGVDRKDDPAQKKEKRDKAEQLRQQLLGGADFAGLARKTSDDPSKQEGGDLGLLYRGQSLKPFEDAAFAQQINEIGPVVETDYGYHLIQVLERRPPQQVALNEKIRKEIAAFIVQRKQAEAFAGIMKRLKAKATIVLHDEK